MKFISDSGGFVVWLMAITLLIAHPSSARSLFFQQLADSSSCGYQVDSGVCLFVWVMMTSWRCPLLGFLKNHLNANMSLLLPSQLAPCWMIVEFSLDGPAAPRVGCRLCTQHRTNQHSIIFERKRQMGRKRRSKRKWVHYNHYARLYVCICTVKYMLSYNLGMPSGYRRTHQRSSRTSWAFIFF